MYMDINMEKNLVNILNLFLLKIQWSQGTKTNNKEACTQIFGQDE